MVQKVLFLKKPDQSLHSNLWWGIKLIFCSISRLSYLKLDLEKLSDKGRFNLCAIVFPIISKDVSSRRLKSSLCLSLNHEKHKMHFFSAPQPRMKTSCGFNKPVKCLIKFIFAKIMLLKIIKYLIFISANSSTVNGHWVSWVYHKSIKLHAMGSNCHWREQFVGSILH